MSNNIYVGNLPWSYRDDKLKELFEEHGEVTSAKVIVDRMSGRSRDLDLSKWQAKMRLHQQLKP